MENLRALGIGLMLAGFLSVLIGIMQTLQMAAMTDGFAYDILWYKKLCQKVKELTEQRRGDPLRSEEIHRALDKCNHAATRGCIYRGRSRH